MLSTFFILLKDIIHHLLLEWQLLGATIEIESTRDSQTDNAAK